MRQTRRQPTSWGGHLRQWISADANTLPSMIDRILSVIQPNHMPVIAMNLPTELPSKPELCSAALQ